MKKIASGNNLGHHYGKLMWPSVDPYALSKYEVLLSQMGNLSGKRVLVVGCGNGIFVALLASRGALVKAIDIDAKPIQLTKDAALKAGLQIETENTSLEDYVSLHPYDFVVATDVIEHIKDDHAAIQHLQRHCEVNGRFILTVPAMSFLFGYHDELLGHYRRYSKKNLRVLLASHMKFELIRYFGFFLVPVALLTSRILRMPYPNVAEGKSWIARVVDRVVALILEVEKKLSPPLGTSLLVVGVNHGKQAGC